MLQQTVAAAKPAAANEGQWAGHLPVGYGVPPGKLVPFKKNISSGEDVILPGKENSYVIALH